MIPTFFHGLRRKAGCVLLVMASMVATAWCRSLTVRDQLNHVTGNTLRQITSNSGVLRCEAVGRFDDFLDSSIPESGWSTRLATEPDHDGYGSLCRWRCGWGGFRFAEGKIGRSQICSLAIPYWSMALPFTIAAAYLILWPGKRTPRHPQS